MICSDEARGDLAAILGVAPRRVTRPTWVNHLYSCDYQYPNGVVSLSVKELATADDTIRYFERQAVRLGRTPGSFVMGDAWFSTRNDSIVLRKDFKVLFVDVSRAPERLGKKHALNPEQAALNYAETIMGCWVDA